MQGNCLETDEVVAAWDGAGDGSSPAAVLLDHLVGRPETFGNSSREEAGLIDFELHRGETHQ